MRTIVFSAFIIIACVFSNAHAQTYKINKQNYDYQMYIPQPGDPFNPQVAGIASFIAPGYGQMMCGEIGRGFAFMGGFFVVGSITALGVLTSYKEDFDNPNNDKLIINPLGVAIFLVGLSSWIGLGAWSRKDAIKVAKVNNMYFQDMRGNLSLVKVELNPFVDTNNYLGQINASAGLSLKITF